MCFGGGGGSKKKPAAPTSPTDSQLYQGWKDQRNQALAGTPASPTQPGTPVAGDLGAPAPMPT
jgi:hypothetical protein